jgi:hypothetical protein
VCFIVHKTILKLERVILTTLFLRWILPRHIVRLENFMFIVDYFGSLSLSPRRDMQALPSWAQLTMRHQPHGGP